MTKLNNVKLINKFNLVISLAMIHLAKIYLVKTNLAMWLI
jgi:hypothetical protein